MARQRQQILHPYVSTIPNIVFIADIVPCFRRWLKLLLSVALAVQPLVPLLRRIRQSQMLLWDFTYRTEALSWGSLALSSAHSFYRTGTFSSCRTAHTFRDGGRRST